MAGEMVLANFAGTGQMGVGYSGGPVVIFPDGQQQDPQLVGVVSRGVSGLSTEETFGPLGTATDLTQHREWLNGAVRSSP